MTYYDPNDFSLESYRKLLLKAKEKFIFKDFNNFSKDGKFILWRHDIDFSVEQALELAKIENELNIKSTYFIHLHSMFYNPLEKNLSAMINEIIFLGHKLGLHFDCDYYEIESAFTLEKYLAFEKNILQQLYKVPIEVFSFHNTSPLTMTLNQDQYAGMINTYSTYFQNDLPYCSDSNGYWRYANLHHLIEDPTIERLHVLTHPEWWIDNPLLPRDKILFYTKLHHDKQIHFYDQSLKIYSRENIGFSQ